ncbi:MAG: SpoIID/LytB domain-containing protein [Muribaculaceae bacterium]|nr:SpoIID/LytB domain-containing protein [Roseburia sp.]MCM1430450.1 SpoIID/LytB domain-containing protein [Muribaculaceae bacterium]MCM1492354.1 SpoIID/LytB domain-containing protein [Muribaculaceae bacterium]
MKRKDFIQWLGVAVLGVCALLVVFFTIRTARRGNFSLEERGTEESWQGIPEGRVENVYIESCGGGEITFWYQGQRFSLAGTLADSYTGVADLEILDGEILEVSAKPEVIEGILDSYTESTVQVSGFEVLSYAGELPVYVLPTAADAEAEKQVSQKALTDLVIGTSRIQLVVANGEACAVIQHSRDVYENVRVLIKNKTKITYEKLYLTSDKAYQAKGRERKAKQAVSAAKLLKGCETGDEVRISAKKGLLYLCDKEGNLKGDGYEGEFLVRKCEDGYVLVNEVPIETYLRYVLPSEMPTYFSFEALKAQAVCARTFAYKQMQENTYAAYGANLDDSTSFQVYHATGTYEITDRAVLDTEGLVLTEKGKLIDCYYYSTGSGYSENLEVWNAKSPGYLVAENHTKEKTADLSDTEQFHSFISAAPAAYDEDSPYYRWSAQLSAKLGMDEKYGRLKKLRVNERSSSGYILSLTVVFEEGERTYEKENDIRFALGKYVSSVTLADGTVRNAFGSVPSACFEVVSQKDGEILLQGGGFGHGIGMSQYGADRLGQEGKTWQEILAFYYKGTEITAR